MAVPDYRSRFVHGEVRSAPGPAPTGALSIWAEQKFGALDPARREVVHTTLRHLADSWVDQGWVRVDPGAGPDDPE